MKKSAIFLMILLVLSFFAALSGCQGKVENMITDTTIFDTTGQMIDGKRAFSEMKDVKSYKNMLLFRIEDEKLEEFICIMDDNGKNLKKVFQYDGSNITRSSNKSGRVYYYSGCRQFKASDFDFTINGKIIIRYYIWRACAEEGSHNEHASEDDLNYYMADWDGGDFRAISREMYYNYYEKYRAQ